MGKNCVRDYSRKVLTWGRAAPTLAPEMLSGNLSEKQGGGERASLVCVLESRGA